MLLAPTYLLLLASVIAGQPMSQRAASDAPLRRDDSALRDLAQAATADQGVPSAGPTGNAPPAPTAKAPDERRADEGRKAELTRPELTKPELTKPELTKPGDLVLAVRGDLPIILTAPHGGVVRIPGATVRTADGKNKVTVLDDHTAELALLVGQRITSKLGGKPYLVIAEFSRKHADANRSIEEGVEDDLAKRHYLAFHSAARQSVDEIRAQFGRGLLIDIHGQGREPGAIIRGTRNGVTTRRLLASFGASALTGPESIFGVLKARGYTVLPPAGGVSTPSAKPSDAPSGPGAPPVGTDQAPETAARPDDELSPTLKAQIGRETFLDGGFIVFHYGSQNATGIDAIQMEFGRARKDDPMKLAQDVGDAIVTFARAYLPLRSPSKASDEADESEPQVKPARAPAAPSESPSTKRPSPK